MNGIPHTPWFPCKTLPAYPGTYRVRNNPTARLSARSRHTLVGSDMRYFDGQRWILAVGWLQTSVFGNHPSHEWQGLALPPDGPWKVGDEWLPFHPRSSVVVPDYRDGWNAAYIASLTLRR